MDAVKPTDREVVMLQRIEIGKLMRRKREKLCLTQEQAAKEAKMNYHSFVRAELGTMGHAVRAQVIRWLQTKHKPKGKKR